jgi:CRISPR-associated protein Csb2
VGRVKVARYLIDGKVLPRILDSLTVGYIARVAAMSVYGGDERRGSPVFSGKTSEDRVMTGHRHAFYLPSDETGDGKLDHLTIYAPIGFEGNERKALANLERLYGYGLSGELRLVLVGLHEEPDEYLSGDLFGPSSCWVSSTPYMLTRHPKLKSSGRWRTTSLPEGLKIQVPKWLGSYPTGEHLLVDYGVLPDLSGMQDDGSLAQLLLSCKRRGLPEVEIIEPAPMYRRRGRAFRWIEFKRYRRDVASPVIGQGFGFRIVFKEPVTGPLALGHACHYGLGLFRVDGD